MGPTTAALLRYFLADQAFIEARHKLDAATKNVRVQEAKAALLKVDHDAAHASHMGAEAKAREVEGDLKARDARIEFLRDRQTNASAPKEYQALIVEISTQKLDKAKLEEQALALMEQAETLKTTVTDLRARFDAEHAKHKQMAGEIDQRVRELSAQVDALRAPRDEAAAALPAPAMASYNRAAERYEGEALACLEKPNPRDQEYLCAGCNTYLVADIYNRLRNAGRDEIVTCPSCTRILYIPDEMTAELGLATKAARGEKPKKVKVPKEPKVPGEKKKRAPSVKKKKPGEMNAVEAAIAEGSSSARGKGPEHKPKPTAAPLPSTADGISNTADEATESTNTESTNEDESPVASEQSAT